MPYAVIAVELPDGQAQIVACAYNEWGIPKTLLSAHEEAKKQVRQLHKVAPNIHMNTKTLAKELGPEETKLFMDVLEVELKERAAERGLDPPAPT